MKKAIILAGGLGSRLRPLTEEKPKALVEVNGKPILGHTLDAILANGIRDIVIVKGYKGHLIEAYCVATYPKQAFTFVENPNAEGTNNLYSLYLARTHLKEDVLIMNGDLVFDHAIIGRLKGEKGTSIAVDVGRYMEESMKVVVEGGVVKSISKQITPEEAHGCSIDIYRFNRADLPALVKELERTIKSGSLKEWTEAGFNRLFAVGAIRPTVTAIGKARWYEIDNLEDLRQAERLFNPRLKELSRKKIFFIDNDGTLSLDGKLLPGAKAFISSLIKAKKRFYICTNNSSYAPADIAAKMRTQGLPITEKHVLISTEAAMSFLKEQKARRLFWVANRAATAWLKKARFVFDAKKPEALLLCYDTTITYEKLKELVGLVRAGVPYYATHIDKVCPTKDGPVPDAGLFIDLVEGATGVRPLQTFGKPDKNFILPILNAHKLSPKDAVVIGDRLYTDIAMGSASGALSILALSGETKRADYETSPVRADILVGNVEELIPYLNGAAAKSR